MSENKTAKTPTDDGHVAHVYLFEKTGRPMVAWDNAKDIKLGDRLYAAPKREWVALTDREWVALTDEEIYEYADKYLYQHGSNYGIKAFGKAIEAKLKEKNT